MTRGSRTPSPEDLRLWRSVTSKVTPIGRPTDASTHDKESAQRAQRAHPSASIRTQKPLRSESPRPAILDRRSATRIARGRTAIDARVDLHGLTQEAAHRRLAAFLHDAQADNAGLVLVITGKGTTTRREGSYDGSDGGERGVLRRVVPEWLQSASLRPYVVGFGESARHHGGAGALYVRIRRRRS